ncbi:MAG: hypothetical protein WDM76_11650 [Limisphaerales bacterium]
MIIAVVAVVLLGAGGFYSFKNWSQNQAALEKLNEAYSTLRDLNNQKPSPGNEKVNNIEIAREQQRQVRAWLEKAGKYFQPIPPIPTPVNGVITSEAFAAALHRTINQLVQEAENASVTLPPRYSFSFEAERPLVRFAAGSPEHLARQLGEVKTIAEILFAAKVNSLDNLQRERVSDDDAAGPQADYTSELSVTNDLAVLTPYTVTFRAFSTELSRVLVGFAKSPNGFIIYAIDVEPAGNLPMGQSPEGMAPPPGPQSPPGTVIGRGGLPTVLNEQLLRVTMSVKIVKLLPKK